MAAPNEKSGPVNVQGAAVIDGIHTDVVCSDFEDRLFIVVTQYQKIGTLVHVTKDVALEEGSNLTYTTRVLLGIDEPITHVLARSLAEKMNVSKSIIFAFALQDTARKTLKAVEELVLKTRQDGGS